MTGGKYTGFESEEPEYEQWAAWGSQIGNPGPAEALVLGASDTGTFSVGPTFKPDEQGTKPRVRCQPR